MLITRETDYALRILRALSGGAQLTAGEISEQELVPHHFAYKILKKMNRAHLVHVSRGADGGCRLEADLHTVTLYDLISAMEADSLVVACMEPDFQCPWQTSHAQPCTVHRQLCRVQHELDNTLRSYSLHQILFGET